MLYLSVSFDIGISELLESAFNAPIEAANVLEVHGRPKDFDSYIESQESVNPAGTCDADSHISPLTCTNNLASNGMCFNDLG